MEKVKLKDIKKAYRKIIKQEKDSGTFLTVDNLLSFSIKQYSEIHVENILSIEEDGDMLLFQYGSYDEKSFYIDITRQLIPDEENACEDENIWQLSLVFFYDVKDFVRIEDDNSWNTDFKTTEEWLNQIKHSEVYRIAKNLTAIKYELDFSQV